jgi:hypothetical protein
VRNPILPEDKTSILSPLIFDKMVVVAVAGGTGHLGLTIVEALISTGEHSVKVLSRKVSLALIQCTATNY